MNYMAQKLNIVKLNITFGFGLKVRSCLKLNEKNKV